MCSNTTSLVPKRWLFPSVIPRRVAWLCSVAWPEGSVAASPGVCLGWGPRCLRQARQLGPADWLQLSLSLESPASRQAEMDTVGSCPGTLAGQESACSAGEPCSVPRSGRSPGDGNDNPLWYSCLENSLNRGAWGATVHGVSKSRTQLSDFNFSVFPVSQWLFPSLCLSQVVCVWDIIDSKGSCYHWEFWLDWFTLISPLTGGGGGWGNYLAHCQHFQLLFLFFF